MERVAELFTLTNTYFEDDDEKDSTAPLLDLYIQENGGNNAVVKTMTPFSNRKFERLWDQVGVDFIVGMTNKKGPNSTTTPKDIFFWFFLF